jgi:hypothetical protein
MPSPVVQVEASRSTRSTRARQQQAWGGHLPETRRKLLAILERVVRGDSHFTLAERGLVTACEFWALAMAGDLHRSTGSRAISRLRFISTIYAAMGAASVAAELRDAHRFLTRAHTLQQRRMRFRSLENSLRDTTDAVDALIAQFARDLLPTTTVTTAIFNGNSSMARSQGLRGIRPGAAMA